ncbi:MAG: methionyl-tRNA formyltransferase, partial [Oscillospiraceae bacterium]|nr:methionyl-tRNA formyltransferase [Oscillospiraceae bacterium]
KVKALEFGLSVHQPVMLKDGAVLEILRELRPDIIVVAAYGKILPQDILSLPPLGCVNIHASLLPKYRGASPIQQAVLNGDTETGITLMQMDKGLDTGDILAQANLPILPEDTAGTVHDKLAIVGARLLIDTLPRLARGEITPIKQEEALATAAPLITKADGKIDWNRPASEILNKIRGMNPWPAAYTFIGGKQLKIFSAVIGDELPGTAGGVFIGESMCVRCGNGSLVLGEVQLEGKKRMAAVDFVRGFHAERGRFQHVF